MSFPTRREVDGLVARALAEDPQFRTNLLADPRGALSALIGVPIPAAVNVVVHEESLTDIHLVIPAAADNDALSDSDLELVAGGASCWDNCGCTGP